MCNTTFATYIYAVILPPDAQQWWEPAFSLPCLSFVPPFALPPFLLPASLQPSPLPLPRRSIVSAWFSSLSLSCSICSLASPSLSSLSQTQRSVPFGLRGGEGKHFKLQIQPGKQGSTDSRAHPQAARIRMCADTYWFVSSKLKYTYPLLSLLSSAASLTSLDLL